DGARVGCGDDRVGAEDEQGARAAAVFAERVQQLGGRHAGAGQRGRVDAPDGGDVRPGRGVVDAPVPGELVGLLAVLAPALAVALAGKAAVPGARTAGQAQREGEVDERGDRVGAVG